MKSLKRYHGGEGGFTLIEVVIASVILAIVVTGIAFFFMNIIKASDQMDDKSKALEICREGIETLRTMDVVSMSDGWQNPPFVVEGFTRSIWIDTPYATYPEAKHVRCRVTWTGIDGADSLSLSTIL
jgi:prepilin-type N-terminal cleavage/methylation domain-containing protein